jgi:hypothetical protein
MAGPTRTAESAGGQPRGIGALSLAGVEAMPGTAGERAAPYRAGVAAFLLFGLEIGGRRIEGRFVVGGEAEEDVARSNLALLSTFCDRVVCEAGTLGLPLREVVESLQGRALVRR